MVYYVTIIGDQVDVITEGKQNKRKKKHTKNNKEFVTDGSTSSSSPVSVTADITDSTMSPCHSNIVTVTDDDRIKISEGIRKLRKRSLPSITSTNMLLEQGDGKKKKRRSFHSRLADGVICLYVCVVEFVLCACTSMCVYVCVCACVHVLCVCTYVCVYYVCVYVY